MKNILMIVQNDFVNDSRIIKEANTLGKYGFNVKVLALYNKGLKEDEEFEHFIVKRIRLGTRDKLSKGKLSQVVKYIEFKKKCLQEAKKFNPDIVHCHDVYTLPIGKVIIKKLSNSKKIKFIYDSHELWSQASNNLSMPNILVKLQNNIEKNIIKECDKVITVSNSIAEYLMKRCKLEKKPSIIRNIPYMKKDITNKSIFHEKFNIEKDKKIVLYQGAVGKGRGIENLIKSMKYTENNIVLVILGNGSMVKKYKEIANELRLEDKVYFHSAVDPKELMDYTSSANLGMSLIFNICLSYYYSLPNKMFEYIQGEIPVLCSNYPDMEEIIQKYEVGQTVEPNDVAEIAKAINEVLSKDDEYYQYKSNCKIAKDQLNWEKESNVLIQLYKDIIDF
ncbi:glycosyltransferase family 4 protein [Clostridium sporogenes]|uniref:Glycosyltransferase family 4 protein n=1 Tax=Clostridium sporogenes TaxID=1509 RepID=A0AAE4FJW9_CLOSG|nr:glycosyltransferase family 4 protein [Clostridium sporogenes]MDS1003626.1 glycosyltransferase family 4 protein [Clostridium sporogenes]